MAAIRTKVKIETPYGDLRIMLKRSADSQLSDVTACDLCCLYRGKDKGCAAVHFDVDCRDFDSLAAHSFFTWNFEEAWL